MQDGSSRQFPKLKRIELEGLSQQKGERARGERMLAERGVPIPVLTKRHEDRGTRESSAYHGDLAKGFGGLLDIDNPFLRQFRKYAGHSLFEMFAG